MNEDGKTTQEETEAGQGNGSENQPKAEGTPEAEQGNSNPQPSADASGKGGDGSTKAGSEKKPEMPKEERSAQAEMRRLREQNEAYRKQLDSLQADRKEQVTDRALEELGITKADLDDPDSLKLAEWYMQGLAKGDQNPALYAYRQQSKAASQAKRKAKEEAEAQTKAKAEQEKRVREDADSFRKQYPSEDIVKVTKSDSDFMKTMEKHGIKAETLMGNITPYYSLYCDLKGIKPSEQAKTMGNAPTSGTTSNQGPEDDMPDPNDPKTTMADIEKWERKHGLL